MVNLSDVGLSVILPVHNAMPYLKETIESIMDQTYQDFIVLAIDNGSYDGSGEFLKSFKNDRIRYIRLEKPSLVKSLNTGLKLSKTPFIARMDADDIIDPKRFEKQIEFLKNNAEVGLVGTHGYYISRNGIKRTKIYLPTNHDEIIRSMLNTNHAIIHPSILFRREILEKVGGYSKKFYPCEDYDFFLRCGLVTRLANLNDRFYYLRVTEDSVISRNIEESIEKYHIISELYSRQYKFIKGNQQKWLRKADVLAVTFYRKGLGIYLNRNRFVGAVLVLLSSIINPLRFINAIKKRRDSLFIIESQLNKLL